MLDVFWTLGKFTPYRWAMIQYQGVRIRSNQPMTVMKLKKSCGIRLFRDEEISSCECQSFKYFVIR